MSSCVRLQVESYIHSLYSENPALCDVSPNAPVQGNYFVNVICYALQVCLIVFSISWHIHM